MFEACLNLFFALCLVHIGVSDEAPDETESINHRTVYTQAKLTVTYDENYLYDGKYGDNSLKSATEGYLYFSKIHGYWCTDIGPPKGNEPVWIAIIPRGNCSYERKVLLAKKYNASGVIIYNINEPIITPRMSDRVPSMVSVIVNGDTGRKLVNMAIKGQSIAFCAINVGTLFIDKKEWKVSQTSVLFVLVSFILLMCISLAWLVFYYVQRFRHIYRNDRKEKQLLCAAKKAISKLKTVSFQHDSEEDESCAICLDNYKDGETLRILPCKHSFHKSCIDPWLLKHRTCPMCKSNILKALGVELPFVNVESPTATSVHPSAIPLPMQETSRQINTEATVSVATNTETTVPDVNTPQAWQTSTVSSASLYTSSSTEDVDTNGPTTESFISTRIV